MALYAILKNVTILYFSLNGFSKTIYYVQHIDELASDAVVGLIIMWEMDVDEVEAAEERMHLQLELEKLE